MFQAELYHDNFQNFKRYNIPKAQLVIADIPYNIAENAYGSNPAWYIDGDRKNGESKNAKSAFFRSDYSFNICEYFHFCNHLLKKEPKEKGSAPCMIVFVRGELLLDADVLWIARAGEPDAFHKGLEEVCTIGGLTFYREEI